MKQDILDGNENENPYPFDNIAVISRKGKYIISARFQGRNLPEMKITQEDYMLYASKITTKQQLADKYFGPRIEERVTKGLLISIVARLTTSLHPENELAENEKETIRDYFSQFGSTKEKESILDEIWEKAQILPGKKNSGEWLRDAKVYLHEIVTGGEQSKSVFVVISFF